MKAKSDFAKQYEIIVDGNSQGHVWLSDNDKAMQGYKSNKFVSIDGNGYIRSVTKLKLIKR